MTLHEAIEKVLRQTGRPMTKSEIADELNKNKWYQKKDGSTIDPYQIHGRTKNYPQLFSCSGSTISLIGQSNTNVIDSVLNPNKDKPILNTLPFDATLFECILMDEKNFKSAAIIDNLVPDNPGLYCIRIKDFNLLPKPFDGFLRDRNHNIIYIGLATKSLSRRFLNQELRANGHGTFFRSIGAILGYRPVKGSLLTKANKRNYTFTTSDNQKIIEWINNNLTVNWVDLNEDIQNVETGIIQGHLPLLNLAKNPASLKFLIDLRAECVRIANS